jgi:molybdopterin-synthase adenylyltransferase
MGSVDFPMVILSREVAVRMEKWGSTWGWLDLKVDDAEGLAIVVAFSNKEKVKLPVATAWIKSHYLWPADARENAAVWYRVDPELHLLHEALFHRQLGVATSEVQKAVLGGWRSPPVDRSIPVVTLSGGGEDARWSCWWVSREGASPGLVHLVDDDADLLEFLRPAWPLGDLEDATVTMVGVGSIGSAAAEVLASYGIGRLCLVDPQRLLQRNVVRHRLESSQIGRHKVTAMRDRLVPRYPRLELEIYPLDVIRDADVMRPLFERSDIVLGATDGVGTRRVLNHLSRRAAVPLVLACVLEDGALGEVLRIRPGYGCLICNREALVEEGSLDPEPDLDLGYGTGTRHLPMTAASGDLAFIGTLAAKAVVATLLEQKGHWAQRLPGEHGLVALRPVPDLRSPFDLEETGGVRWNPPWSSRSGCPSCSPA